MKLPDYIVYESSKNSVGLNDLPYSLTRYFLPDENRQNPGDIHFIHIDIITMCFLLLLMALMENF